jgi:hypothetical protein
VSTNELEVSFCSARVVLNLDCGYVYRTVNILKTIEFYNLNG